MQNRKEALKRFFKRAGVYPIVHFLYTPWRVLSWRVLSAVFSLNPIQENKIVLDNFLGRGYGDNPQFIAEEILRRGLPYDLVWLVRNMDTEMPSGIRKVRCGSPAAMREAAAARMWISNVRNTPLPVKRKGQIYLQTWHGGFPFKRIEGQAENLSRNYIRAAQRDGKKCDAILVSSGYMREIMERYFWLNRRVEYLHYGTPRDDILFRPDRMAEYAEKVRACFRLPEDMGVVLYLPTFRDSGDTGDYGLDYARVIAAFEKREGRKFVLLVRLHPNVAQFSGRIPVTEKIINATDYPEANELYSVADALISDYSSVLIPFFLMHKPAFRFAPDLEQYRRERGLTEIYDSLPCPLAENNDELEEAVLHYDKDRYEAEWTRFYETLRPCEDGHAAERTVDWIERKMSGRDLK